MTEYDFSESRSNMSLALSKDVEERTKYTRLSRPNTTICCRMIIALSYCKFSERKVGPEATAQVNCFASLILCKGFIFISYQICPHLASQFLSFKSGL